MKSITLSMLQAIRLTMMLDAHQGTRKDLRMLAELRGRLGITEADLTQLLTPLAGTNGAFVISAKVIEMPLRKLDLIPEEARRVLEILNGQQLTVRDLTWTEPMAKELEAACGD